ncbi:serine/threonine protein kinase [Sporobacter termitidis DSM 10068]|uniref:non-specific serine/threonine protein kinase n=1 Tax=Sporobacter termitidis DSM 10068 TaxID=1123282 RepID=A0A1M5TH99_9FIRM|nr:Stk1 family PASTA domain-containing Ser/Thr kinase [Sporobacter termitidis]SHH50048.1 serine/threonine protein kinase [Sporobacter termitidis DSM 10068]
MDSTDKYIGQLLDNRYEILEKIGSGGMAVVYKARCHRLNRLVAVKILKEELAEDADFRRRFRTESQAVAMLSHPNIVAVYDVSRSGNIEYIVMELIEGITLKQYINRKGLLNWKEALHFSTQVAKALSHAHSRGIIHRDIKPHNIMILKDGSVKVADFGIARLQSTQNTLTQEALGSVHYISPEQAKGSHVDARSDIYSLGVVMYEMLTSHLPFEGDSAVSIAIQHISAIPLMPREINPDIPLGLESITMHAMEPDLNLRYASTDEMLADLEEFRKNPAINFTYYVNDNETASRRVSDQATREVPTSAIIKAENALPKAVRTPSRSAELSRAEYRKSSKRSSKTSTLVGIFLIIVFLVGIFVFMYIKFIGPMLNPTVTTVDIPNFAGQKYSDIQNNPDNQTFAFKVEEQYDDTVEEGYVISQDPTARQVILPASGKYPVSLVVSQGKKPDVLMPDCTKKNYMQARIDLEQIAHDQGWTLNIETQAQTSEDVTADYVISTVPAADIALFNNETITIIYSTGPAEKKEKVPNVVGLPIETAQDVLFNAGFVPKNSGHRNHADVPKGYVISQDPESPDGQTLAVYKSNVNLIVSDGPEETSPSPPPSTSPSPSPSPETSVSPPTPSEPVTPPPAF